MANTIRIHTLWGTRKGFEDEVPELMVAWDEFAVDNYPEGFAADKQEAIDSWQDDLAAQRDIVLEVPFDQIEDAFKAPTVAVGVSGA